MIVVGENERSHGRGMCLIFHELDRHRQREFDGANRPVTRAHEQQPTRMADYDLRKASELRKMIYRNIKNSKVKIALINNYDNL